MHNIANTNLAAITANTVVATVELMDTNVEEYNYNDRYVRLALVGSVNSLTAGAVGLGAEAEFKPASKNNLNTTYLNQQVVCQ